MQIRFKRIKNKVETKTRGPLLLTSRGSPARRRAEGCVCVCLLFAPADEARRTRTTPVGVPGVPASARGPGLPRSPRRAGQRTAPARPPFRAPRPLAGLPRPPTQCSERKLRRTGLRTIGGERGRSGLARPSSAAAAAGAPESPRPHPTHDTAHHFPWLFFCQSRSWVFVFQHDVVQASWYRPDPAGDAPGPALQGGRKPSPQAAGGRAGKARGSGARGRRCQCNAQLFEINSPPLFFFFFHHATDATAPRVCNPPIPPPRPIIAALGPARRPRPLPGPHAATPPRRPRPAAS
ncbi:uncharacterized protein RHO17_025789 [Thomomys bottae]